MRQRVTVVGDVGEARAQLAEAFDVVEVDATSVLATLRSAVSAAVIAPEPDLANDDFLYLLRLAAPDMVVIASGKPASLSLGADGFLSVDAAAQIQECIVRRTERRRRQCAADACHVLIIDDDPLVLPAIAAGLERGPVRVFTATTREAALALLREHPIHVLISDFVMPETSGPEMLHAARCYDPTVITMLMTGAPSFEAAAAAMQERCHHLLPKPFKNAWLRASVEKAWQEWLCRAQGHR